MPCSLVILKSSLEYHIELPGNRKESSVFVYNDYSYHEDKRCKGSFRCSIRRDTSCHGTLMTIKENTVIKYILKTEHDHEPDREFLKLHNLKSEMLFMCRTTLLPSKEIFDKVCRSNPEAAKNLTFVSMKSILNRERAKSRPAVPKTIGALSDLLQDFEPLKTIYKESVVAKDGKMALIFSSAELLEALASTSEILVDGMFSGIATIFILSEARTTAVYRAVWEKILELAPGLQENLKLIMTDYEKAAITAMSECFPNAAIHGCWFHYNQAVFRKWRRLGLTNAPRKLVSMAMTVPLTPHTCFKRSFTIMQSVADAMFQKYPQVKSFMTYMRTFWLPIAEKVSVYGCPIRTNNIVESFHNTASGKLGGMHPGLWNFFENLKQLIIDQEIDLGRLKRGRQIRRKRTRVNREKEEKVLQLQKDLVQKRIPLTKFLQLFHTFYDDY